MEIVLGKGYYLQWKDGSSKKDGKEGEQTQNLYLINKNIQIIGIDQY